MTARLTLALLFIIPAAMSYPWESTLQRWVLAAAAVVVIVLFAWWRGSFVTDMVAQRVAMFGRNHSKRKPKPTSATTVVLRAEPGEAADFTAALPLALIAGYLDRYGVRSDAVRVTSRDVDGERTTWISLTLDAADNLTALKARSPQLPLRETAEVAARRLAEHLREAGCEVAVVDEADTPVPSSAKESWRGMRVKSGTTSAYRVVVDDRLAETLEATRFLEVPEIWTALEISGTSSHPNIAVACALRREGRTPLRLPVKGLTLRRGLHRPALEAMDPFAVQRLHGDAEPLPAGLLETLDWVAATDTPTQSVEHDAA